MKFRSTNRKCDEVRLCDAVLQGLAPDGGLYVPVSIPTLPPHFFTRMRSMKFPETAVEVMLPFVGNEIPEPELARILLDALTIPVPLVTLSPRLHVLELFHGPTLAFKDFGARTMARLLSYFAGKRGGEFTVLVATSGDTGSAVAQGFLGVSGVRVAILYPAGRVSAAQEKQFTTLGQNITALEVAGVFDDCQRLLKQAFADAELTERIRLTTGNSINIARLLPQMFYYFSGVAKLKDRGTPVAVSVPSGNFGNLTAGVMAKHLGLPVAQFIAATNVNDVVPEYLRSGSFRPRPSQPTLSSAMDVGNPSNFARLTDLYQNDLSAMRREIWGCTATDDETLQAMKSVHERFGYLTDPHTAVGILAFERFLKQRNAPSQGIVLGTAHPGKFRDAVARATGVSIPLPEPLAAPLALPKQSIALPNTFEALKQFLLG